MQFLQVSKPVRVFVATYEVPKELPTYQHEQVRVYKRGTPIGDVIDTVLAPGEGNDKKLIDKFSEAQPKHGEIIEQFRQLVAE